MVLTPHLLAGAAIASNVQSPALALVIAFLSHFLLDILPHREYSIRKIKEKKWRESFSVFLKMAADMSIGLLAIFLLSENTPIIYAAAFVSILSDGANLLNIILPSKLLGYHLAFHQKIHFFEGKKISVYWRVLSESLVIFLSIFYLR